MEEKKDIIYFAETTFRRKKLKVGIKTDDRRRHIYVVGKTGMGKTAMQQNMIIQDIKSGRGTGIIDPHGDLAEELLDLIPSSRINDVVYFNPADIDYPIAFNVMENVGDKHRHLISSGLMDVFKKIWPDVWSSRMEYILENAVLALLEYPNTTLLGINRMLSDEEYRKKIVNNTQDTIVKAFWLKEFKKYPKRYKTEATAAIQNKIGQLIANPLIRNIVGQVKSKIDMQEIINDGKILIANLSKGRIGEENSKLLGALLVTKLQLAAMTRVDVLEEERRDFFLYVDEFQNFATESFASILSEARKYRLCLTLANQYLAQLTEMTQTGGKSYKVRDAVFGNVGTLIVFRVGAEDAEYLEKEFAPELYAKDLVDLGKYQIYLRLMVDGIAGRPFSAQTFPPSEPEGKSSRNKIIRGCRERYASPKQSIEDKIRRWSGLDDKEDQKKSKEVKYNVTCSACGKDTQVNFRPDGVRPVYCPECFKKVQERRQKKSAQKPKPNVKEKVKETKKSISLKEIKEEEPTKKKKHKKKVVDIDELKKALGQALKKKNKE